MFVKCKVRIPAAFDNFLGRFRWYRRHEMRRSRKLAAVPFQFSIKPEWLDALAAASQKRLDIQLRVMGRLSICLCGAPSLGCHRLCGVCRRAWAEAESDLERDRR